MKKLFLVLLVVALASFLFVGCLPVTPSEGEGEGEGECEVTVEIDGAVVLDSKTYISCGNHDITVTFCAPVVGGVSAYITCCTGDYSTMKSENNFIECGSEVVLFPDATGTIWTGSGYFGCNYRDSRPLFDCDCCASYVEIWAGECEPDACIWFPVIVDCCPPYALIDIDVDNCVCDGCEITFESGVLTDVCDPDEECCDDLCSGLAGWSIVLYDGYPFDECCDPSICEEPIGSCSGIECPILCVTDCLDADTYWAVITLVDNVGLETVYYAEITVTGGTDPDDTCDIVVTGFELSDDCMVYETHDYVGTCEEVCGLLY